MVVYLILPLFHASQRKVGRGGGVGGKRGMCRCLSLSAGPGNASDKNLIRLVRRWIQPASPLSHNLCHHRAEEQDEHPTRRPSAHPYVHSFIHLVSAHAIGWSCIPCDTQRQLKMDGKVEFSSVQVHFSWRLKSNVLRCPQRCSHQSQQMACKWFQIPQISAQQPPARSRAAIRGFRPQL